VAKQAAAPAPAPVPAAPTPVPPPYLAPKPVTKPVPVTKPKTNKLTPLLKDQPHVVIEAPQQGPSGQGRKRSYGGVRIVGLYPYKHSAENAARAYVANFRVGHYGMTEPDATGSGYPAVTKGGSYSDEFQVFVKHAGETR
jgi:hypothetical protein